MYFRKHIQTNTKHPLGVRFESLFPNPLKGCFDSGYIKAFFEFCSNYADKSVFESAFFYIPSPKQGLVVSPQPIYTHIQLSGIRI